MVFSVAEVEREKSSSLTTAVETHDAQQEKEAQGVLLELSEELSQAGQDFPSFQMHFCLTPAKIDHYLVKGTNI